MKPSLLALASIAAATAAVQARASDYVNVSYSGEVAVALPGSPVAVATPIDFDVVFDEDKLVDRTASLNAATGADFSSVFTASLSDDPKASLSITIGSISFSKYDQEYYGFPYGDAGPGGNLGVGDFPVATYLGGSFAGVGNIFINSAGYTLDADPIADAFGGFDGFDFLLSQGDLSDPFATPLAVGNYDAADAVFTSVAPEPSAWALLILGFAVLGLRLRWKAPRTLASGAPAA